MLRSVFKPLWILLALLFLAEAWLWEHLEPVAERIVENLPLKRWKAWLGDRVAAMSPPLTLLVFMVPVVLLFPLKLVAVWMMAHHNWLGALLVLAAGKMIGVGVAAFIFDVTRPKLMQMRWFARVYDFVIRVRGWSMTMVAPMRIRLAELRARLAGNDPPRWLRRLARTRRRLLAAR